MSENVNSRNILALASAAKSDRSKVDALLVKLKALEANLTMLQQKVAEMEQRIVVAIVARGSGPTSKG